jgi:hypothetical protein
VAGYSQVSPLRSGRWRGTESGPAINLASTPADFASHKPICAKVRKELSARGHSIGPVEAIGASRSTCLGDPARHVSDSGPHTYRSGKNVQGQDGGRMPIRVLIVHQAPRRERLGAISLDRNVCAAPGENMRFYARHTPKKKPAALGGRSRVTAGEDGLVVFVFQQFGVVIRGKQLVELFGSSSSTVKIQPSP